MSDDGRHGLTLIAFIGSVFSPYYAWARRHQAGDPLHHCALNVALYGSGGKRWSMTERGRGAIARTPTSLAIGPSSLRWDGATLTLALDEVTSPWPSRIRGTVRLDATALARQAIPLDGAGHHRWQPIAPCARVEVELTHPSLRWSGPGYFDTNWGDSPLEDTFAHWHWSRARRRNGTTIFYDICRRDGVRTEIARHCDAAGALKEVESPPVVDLPHSRWRVARATRADEGSAATVVQTLEDAPFYARSLVASRMRGEATLAVHESLSLDRFRKGWVRMLLPFRMPRVG